MSAWCVSSWRSKVRRARVDAGRWLAVLVLLCGFAAGLSAQAEKATCATCHAGVTAHYAHAPMRHAIEPDGANPALATHPDLTTTINGYTYRVQTKDGKSTYTVSDGSGTMTLPVHWFFGQHSQTWVLEKDGQMYESLVSYYPREQELATTPGDQKITPHTLNEAMGRKLPIWETRACFDCHGTNALENQKLALDKVKPGLDCERCHVGSEQHMADALKDNFKTVPAHLRRMDAQQTSNFCGQCHRTWDTVVRNHWHGPAYVRFQPYRLEISKCFIATDKRISCTACHDPHDQVKHDAAYYDAKCTACHGEAHATATQAAVTRTSLPAQAAPMYKVCPVAKANCASCHMPKVELPGGHAQFTDHYIRVVKAGEPYPY